MLFEKNKIKKTEYTILIVNSIFIEQVFLKFCQFVYNCLKIYLYLIIFSL